MHPPAGDHPPSLPESILDGAHHAPPGLSKEQFLMVILIVCGMCLVYVLVGSFFEKHNVSFGHETGLVIVLGVMLSWFFSKNPDINIYLNDKILF